MKKIALFTVIFKDKTSFKGNPDIMNTGWMDIPNKPIKKVFYLLPTGHYLMIYGMEKYYFMVEATKDIVSSKNNKNELKIEYIYFMGKSKDKVICYKVCACNKKIEKIGDMTTRVYNADSAFVKSLNQLAWVG